MQDSLLVAFKQDRLDFTMEQNRKWFTGVLKNRAAMMARSESRRKNREKISALTAKSSPSSDPEVSSHAGVDVKPLTELPPAARKVLALILSGLNRDEICSALSLSPSALRQRLTVIRKALKKLPEDLQREALALAYQRRAQGADDLAFGLIRRALHRLLKQESGIGINDPDGHLLIIKSR